MNAMDPELYTAAQSGNWVVMERFSRKFYSQNTPKRNTVLHVLAQSCDSAHVVQQILAKHSILLMSKNERGETALHLAARKGHSGVVRALIDYAKDLSCSRYVFPGSDICKKMLRIRNADRNTALHEAVRNKCYDVVKLLVEEDPQFQYGINFAMESPLYLAVEKGYHEISDLILVTCKSPSYLGPGNKTALHAAAIKNSPGFNELRFLRNIDCYAEAAELILEKLPNLKKKVDKFGWNALHYAARFNHQEVVAKLLSKYKFMAYVAARNDELKTALHIAVTHGHVAVIQELLSHCPDCWEKTTYKRQNIIHLAVKYEQREVLEFVLQHPWASDLINEKDNQGNTPLHLYAATNNLIGISLVNHPCVDVNAFDNSNSSPLDIILRTDELTARQSLIRDELQQAGGIPGYQNDATVKKKLLSVSKSDELERLERMSGTYLIVATLIATVTFAAGFTVPGGYNGGDGQDKGMAVLGKKAAFITFVISDSLATMLSVGAVFQQLKIVQTKSHKLKLVLLQNIRADISAAVMLMVIAFVSGLHAVIQILMVKIVLCVMAVLLCYNMPFNFLRLREKPKRKIYVTKFKHSETDYSAGIGGFRIWFQDLTEED